MNRDHVFGGYRLSDPRTTARINRLLVTSDAERDQEAKDRAILENNNRIVLAHYTHVLHGGEQ